MLGRVYGTLTSLAVDAQTGGWRLRLRAREAGHWEVRVVTPGVGNSVRLRRTDHPDLAAAIADLQRRVLDLGLHETEEAWLALRTAFQTWMVGRPGLRAQCAPLRAQLNTEADRTARLRIGLARALGQVVAFAQAQGITIPQAGGPGWLPVLVTAVDNGQADDQLEQAQLALLTDALLQKTTT